LEEAAELLESWAAVVDTQLGEAAAHLTAAPCPTVSVLAALCNDLATPEVRALLIGLGRRATEETSAARELLLCCEFLGVMDRSTVGLLSRQFGGSDTSPESMVGAFDPVERYRVGRLNGDPSAEAVLADELRSLGITYSLSQTGKVLISDEATGSGVEIQINDRLAALNARDFVKADAIRADLLAQGIQLMDYKDPATGERRTKWEVKR
jgi:cysteinyl-tRNA synthetase